jgi:hypothetical protein
MEGEMNLTDTQTIIVAVVVLLAVLTIVQVWIQSREDESW